MPRQADPSLDQELQEAAYKGHLAAVKRLLEAGADPHAQDSSGQTALHNAASGHKNVDVVVTLLAAGANPNARDNYGGTPLHSAAIDAHLPIIELLLGAGAHPAPEKFNACTTPLHCLALSYVEDNDIMSEQELEWGLQIPDVLARAGASVFAGNPSPVAFAKGNAEFMRALLKAARSAPSMPGAAAAVVKAAKADDPELLQELLDAGFDPNGWADEEGWSALHFAAAWGNTEAVVALLAAGADPVAASAETCSTPIHIAARHAKPEAVRLLATAWPPGLAAVDSDGWMPIHEAAKKTRDGKGAEKETEEVETLRELLRCGADPCPRTRDGCTSLTFAVDSNRPDLVQALLEAAPSLAHLADREGRSPMEIAVAQGRSAVVRVLAAAGARHPCCDEHGRAPLAAAQERGYSTSLLYNELVEAARAGDVKEMMRLVEGGVPADLIFDDQGTTPLMEAAKLGVQPSVEFLLAAGAPPLRMDRRCKTAGDMARGDMAVREILEQAAQEAIADGLPPDVIGLAAAADEGVLLTIERLVETGVPVDCELLNGNTPLTFAAFAGKSEACRALLKAGADIDHASFQGKTALHQVALMDHAEAAAVLVKADARLEAEEGSGRSPLALAARWGAEDSLKVLLESGADPRHVDKLDRAPMYLAALHGHAGVIKVLAEAGVAPDEGGGSTGQTPLAAAAAWGETDAVRALLEAGTDPGVVDSEGRTPLDLARLGGHTETAELLETALNVAAGGRVTP